MQFEFWARCFDGAVARYSNPEWDQTELTMEVSVSECKELTIGTKLSLRQRAFFVSQQHHQCQLERKKHSFPAAVLYYKKKHYKFILKNINNKIFCLCIQKTFLQWHKII